MFNGISKELHHIGWTIKTYLSDVDQAINTTILRLCSQCPQKPCGGYKEANLTKFKDQNPPKKYKIRKEKRECENFGYK